MRVLLDTNVFLWLTGSSSRLGHATRDIVDDQRNELFLSAASAWELAIKVSLGKLDVGMEISAYVETRIAAQHITLIPLSLPAVLAVAYLPLHHRDPFDRLLIAQAQLADLPVLTSDRFFSRYAVRTLDPAV